MRKALFLIIAILIDFERMHKQRPELERLGQVYDREDQTYLENKLRKVPGVLLENLSSTGCFRCLFQTYWILPEGGGGLDFKSPKFWPLPLFLPTPIGSTIYK